MIKAVLFDLDNTLLDFMRMKQECCRAAVQEMIKSGLKMPAEAALKALFEIYNEFGIEYEKVFQEFFIRNFGKIDYKLLAAGIVGYRKAQIGMSLLYPKVVPTLLKLKSAGLKLGIVSDAPNLKLWLRLTELGLQDFFDCVVGLDDSGARKPARLPFELALTALNLKPEEVLMVGDWIERDIAGAKALGMTTCFARYGWAFGRPPEKSGADYEIDSIDQILEVVGLK